jgi:phage FluMu gp28-like protein
VAGAILLPYQARWVRDTASVVVAQKSRRIGLTWAEASLSVLEAARAKGQDTYYIGYDKDLAREFIEQCGEWARAFQYAAGEIEKITTAGDVLEGGDVEKGVLAYRIVFASGHKIVALSSRPRTLRGKQGRIVVDELAFHEEPEELLKAALAMLIWGGCVRIISTHDGSENPFNLLVQKILAGEKKYSLHTITFDEAVADGLYRRVCDKAGREWTEDGEVEWRDEIVEQYGDYADEELHCIPAAGTGAFIPEFLVRARSAEGIPVVRWQQKPEFAQLPKEARELVAERWCVENLLPLLELLNPNFFSVFGQDFGRVADRTVIWPLQLKPDGVKETPFVVELGCMPFQQQAQILHFILDRLPRFLGGEMDANGNGAQLAEETAQKYGWGRIKQVKASVPWYETSLTQYKTDLTEGALVLPDDEDLRNDHKAARLVQGAPRVVAARRKGKKDGAQRHGDGLVAAVLANNASRMQVEEYGYLSARGPGDHLPSAGPGSRKIRGGPGDPWRDVPSMRRRGTY